MKKKEREKSRILVEQEEKERKGERRKKQDNLFIRGKVKERIREQEYLFSGERGGYISVFFYFYQIGFLVISAKTKL